MAQQAGLEQGGEGGEDTALLDGLDGLEAGLGGGAEAEAGGDAV